MKRAIPREQELTCAELARVLGCRSAGRPTSPDTIRRWMLAGRQGLKLPSELRVCVRVTTWGQFLDWMKRVEEARGRERARRQEAVKEARGRGKRADRARRELERQGAI